MSGRSGGNRRGKEKKSVQNSGPGKMGGPSQANLQKQGDGPPSKDLGTNDKPSEFSSKLQPTAEQIRLATLLQNSSKIAQSDEETAFKIKELMDLTKCDGDKAALVLHDCDYDLTRAVDAILEGGEPIEEWTESVSRKKKRQQSQPLKDSGTNEDAWDLRQEDARDRSRRGGKGQAGATRNGQRRDGERSSRGGPPRLRRGRGGGTAGSPREDDGNYFESDFAEDGRGRRAVNGPGRGGRGGRGGGRVPRTVRGQQQSSDVEGFPQSIETWTNSQAEGHGGSTKTRDLKVGKWDENFPNTEDWDNEEWTGSLADTRVFTPSSVPEPGSTAPKQAAPQLLDDKKDFDEPPKPIGSGVSAENPSLSLSSPAAPALLQEAPVSPNVPKSLSGPPGLSYSPHQGSATLDLATLLGTKPVQHPPHQPAEVVDQRYINTLQPITNEISSAPTNDPLNLFPQMSGQSQQNPGVPVQRSRLKPRPSKIPSTAVEMPHDSIGVLDLQFGGLAFSEIASPPGTMPTAASDPSILSYSVATSSSLPQSSVSSYGAPQNKEVPTGPVAAAGSERKTTAAPGASYYDRASHPAPSPPGQGSSALAQPPATSASGFRASDQVQQPSTANGPHATPQATQPYSVPPASGQYGVVQAASTGVGTTVAGGVYAGSYQLNVNGTATGGKIAPATQSTKDNLPSTSVAPPTAYRQNAAPSKDGVGVPGKPQMQMSGYAAPVTAGAAGMAPMVAHQSFYAVAHQPAAHPTAAPTHYYQTHQVYPVADELSLLTQRMPPMPSATATGVSTATSASSTRDSSTTAAGSSMVGQGGHHQYATSSSVADKFGQQTMSASVQGSNVQARGSEQGSASPAAPTAAVPIAVPVSQPTGAAHYPQFYINYQQQYQGMVPTSYPATAFQTHIFPMPQATSNVHGHGSNNSSQYQKQTAFVPHAYAYSHEHMASAEYGKTYLSNAKPATATGIGGGGVSMQGSDIYAKKVAVSRPGYDKFPTNAMGGTGGPSPNYGQYHPAMVIPGLPTANAAAAAQAQQHQSQMGMQVHAQQAYLQDGAGVNRNSGGMAAQNKVQPKPGGYGTGWSY